MFPGLNPKDIEKAMKKFGIKQEQIDAIEVIIKTTGKDLVIRDPQVSKVNMMGQDTLQIVGKIEEVEFLISREDINTVMQQTGVSEREAKVALEKNKGDLAKTILELSK